MSRSAALLDRPMGQPLVTATARSWGLLDWVRHLQGVMAREGTRRQLQALDDHLRRDVGLQPLGRMSGWSEPVDLGAPRW